MVDLLFDWFGICCMTTDKFCFYLQNRLIQTGQTGGPQYIDTSPFSIPWYSNHCTYLMGIIPLGMSGNVLGLVKVMKC
jgi:hypothetical protein